jgi:hypothetical protein
LLSDANADVSASVSEEDNERMNIIIALLDEGPVCLCPIEDCRIAKRQNR